ncbi:MAG TPA: methyltransferase, partial [Caldilineaceae bacterium]|nr:methyltransferase [Caldilineaceae bacterium]
PDVRADARLVQEGPYRWIRHPMYSGLIWTGLALVLEHPTWPRWGALLALAANFVVKLHVEEHLLRQVFPSYAAYQARTKRLVPFIY